MPPYVKTFNVVRELTAVDAADLTAKLVGAQSGDKINLIDNTYPGDFRSERPNVLVRAGNHSIIDGHMRLYGDNTWLWGAEVVGVEGSLMEVFGKGSVAVNNVLHCKPPLDGLATVGIFANASDGHIIYGNSVYDCKHPVYYQNTAPSHKWHVANVCMDVNPGTNGRVYHEYTQSPNKTENCIVLNSIFANGEFLIGGENNATPLRGNEVLNSVLYKANLALGYKRPGCSVMQDCQIYRATLGRVLLWGVGEDTFLPYPPVPNKFLDNDIWNPGTVDQLNFCTAAYINGQRQEGTPALRPEDMCDSNRYWGGLRATLFANGVNSFSTTLADWQNKTQAAGNRFDINSAVSPNKPPMSVFVAENEYDPTRIYFSVFNPNGLLTISVSRPGYQITVYKIRDQWGSPIASGTGQVAVPLTGEFEAFLMKVTPASSPCDISGITEDVTDAKALCESYVAAHPNGTKKIKTAITKLQSALDKLDEC